MGIRSKLILLLVGLILINLANFLFIRDTENKASEQLGWVEHTHQVLFESQALLGMLRDAETGQRGYLLTREVDYLQPYYSGIEGAAVRFNKLLELTSDNPKQQALLQQISQQMEAKFAELAETIALAGEANHESALAVVRSDRGQQVMLKLRALVAAFDEEEQRLLQLRKQEYDENQALLRQLFALELGFMLMLILLITYYVQLTIVSPLLKLTRNAQEIVEGKSHGQVEIHSQDEIGELARTLNVMNETLNDRAFVLTRLSEELKQERDKALHSSVTDALTGLYNRRKFEEICVQELKRARREANYLDLIIMDIDYFKAINDRYGHARGDQVLQQIGEYLEYISRRPNDFAFRIGGEEFVCIASSENDRAGRTYAELIRGGIEALRIENEGSEISDFVTLSVGVASADPDGDEDFYDLLRRADERLYIAKSLGRNRVVATDEG